VLDSINFDQIIWVDAVVIVVLVLSFGLGILRGIVREILSLSTWIVSIWLAYLYGDNLAIIFMPWLESERLSGLIGYVVVFVAVLVLLSLVGGLLLKLFRVAGLSGADRLLGGLPKRSRDSYSLIVYSRVDASNQSGMVQTFPDRAILRGPAHLVQIQGSG